MALGLPLLPPLPLPRRRRLQKPPPQRLLLRLPLQAPIQVTVETAALPEESAGPLSPLVRKMARENGIDLSQVRGTGAGGRITKQDLEAHINGRSAAPAQAAPAQPSYVARLLRRRRRQPLKLWFSKPRPHSRLRLRRAARPSRRSRSRRISVAKPRPPASSP